MTDRDGFTAAAAKARDESALRLHIMNDIIRPLRLAVGSHKQGSGKGCAMNVISWQSGDTTITDLPACADPMLARVVQKVNDSYCEHRDGDLLCPPCSVAVLALADRTVGTNLALHGWEVESQWRVWVLLAVEEAESVAHLVPEAGRAVAERARVTVRRWLAGEASAQECHAAAYAAYAAADAYADAFAAYAAYAAADAFAAAAAADAADAYAYAAAYAAYADAAADAAALPRAHALIDRFLQHTGITPHRELPVAREQALQRMLT